MRPTLEKNAVPRNVSTPPAASTGSEEFATPASDPNVQSSLVTKSGRAVVLLHGLCSSPLDLRPFARALREHGFHSVTPALTGYGASDPHASRSATAGDYRSWIDAVKVEVDRLALTHSEVTLCGESLGATLALAVAAECPSLDALSLISTTLFFDGWNVSRWRFLLPLLCYTPLGRIYRHREKPPYGVKNKLVRALVAGQLERRPMSPQAASSIPTARLREADRLIRHVKNSLGRIRTPVLLIHSREDDLSSLANVRYVQTRIGSERVAIVLVSDSYHMITLDNDGAYAAGKTIRFFDEIAHLRANAFPGRRYS
jgi:carboxylesterase